MLLNLQVMKLGAELGISSVSNLLIDFPGSTQEEVDATVSAIRRYAWAYEPLALSSFQLQAGSPLLAQPERYAISGVRPIPGYRRGLPADVVARLRFPWMAFESALPTADWSPVRRAVADWRAAWRPGTRALRYHDGGTFLTIIDDRTSQHLEGSFGQLARDLYMYCSEIRTFAQVCRKFPQYDDASLAEALAEFSQANLIAEEDGRYLSLAMAENVLATARRIRAGSQDRSSAAASPGDAEAPAPSAPARRRPVALTVLS